MQINFPPTLKDFSLGEVAKVFFGRGGGAVENCPAKSSTRHVAQLTMADVEQFARECKYSFPMVRKCSVCCEIMSTSAEFRITQIMLDEANNAVRMPSGKEIVGRIICAERLDSRLHAILNGELPREFSFSVA